MNQLMPPTNVARPLVLITTARDPAGARFQEFSALILGTPTPGGLARTRAANSGGRYNRYASGGKSPVS